MFRRCRVIACGFLCALMGGEAHAYRTAGDLPEFAGTPRVRWEIDAIHVQRSEWLPPGLDPALVEEAVGLGFAAWTQLECPTVTFIDDGSTPGAASPYDGRVTVQWVGHDWATLGFDPAAAASTDVIYERNDGNHWRITDADIYLNGESFAWSTDGTALDVQAVVTHEVGHVLGLLHPCEFGGANGAPTCTGAHAALTMYPEYFLEQRTLEPDDQAGVCFLYEPAPCALDGCPAGTICTLEGCALPCDDALCGVGERCGPVGCTAEPCAPGSCERGCEATCETPGGADGDPCDSHLQCFSGHCSPAGYCTPLCRDGACPQGYSCNPDTNPRECVPGDAVFGEPCSSGAQCASGLCLIQEGDPTLCTRPCGGEALDCPQGFLCTAVDGADVCVPPVGSGCAAAPGSAPRGAWVFILFTIALFVLRQRGAS